MTNTIPTTPITADDARAIAYKMIADLRSCAVAMTLEETREGLDRHFVNATKHNAKRRCQYRDVVKSFGPDCAAARKIVEIDQVRKNMSAIRKQIAEIL